MNATMRLRPLLVLLLGLVLAGGSVVLTHKLLKTTAHAPGEAVAREPGIELVEIVVAGADIAFGHAITSDMVRLQPWPKAGLPEGAFTRLADLLGADGSEPRRARRAISAGEPVVVAKVSGFGEKVTIAGTIDPDKRAMAIRVDDVSGVAGFITPGDRVDIVLTRRLDGDGMQADTILQNITVRGVDQVTDEDRDKPSVVRTVTVELTAANAQRLALAQQAGTLSLTLRNLRDKSTSALPTTQLTQLMSQAPPVAPKPIIAIHQSAEGGNFEARMIERYGRDGWACTDDPATARRTPVEGRLIARTCVKQTSERKFMLRTELYQEPGEKGQQLTDAARFEIWGRAG
jgi:pilus assembly protein CpaB